MIIMVIRLSACPITTAANGGGVMGWDFCDLASITDRPSLGDVAGSGVGHNSELAKWKDRVTD